MAKGLAEHVLDLLEGWGGVTARAMFGGHVMYRRGVIFGLIVDDTLYLKADDVNRPMFEERSLPPFSYQAKGRKRASMSYFEAPSECMDDGDELRRWAEAALAASNRKQAVPPKRKKAAAPRRKKKKTR